MSARQSLLSPDWYRVAFMRPRLRRGVRVSRQRVRGETWYVLSDPVSGRHHRFNDCGLRPDRRAATANARSTRSGPRASTPTATTRRRRREAIASLRQAFARQPVHRRRRARRRGDRARAVAQRRARARARRVNPLAFRCRCGTRTLPATPTSACGAGCSARRRAASLRLLVLLGALLLALNADAARSLRASGAHLGQRPHAAPAVARLSADQGAARAGACLRRQGLRRRGARDRHHVAAADAGAVRRCVGLGRPSRASASASWWPAAGIAVEVAARQRRAGCCGCCSSPGWLRDIAFAVAFIGGVSTLVRQRQSAAALRRLPRAVRCARAAQPGAAQRALLAGRCSSAWLLRLGAAPAAGPARGERRPGCSPTRRCVLAATAPCCRVAGAAAGADCTRRSGWRCSRSALWWLGHRPGRSPRCAGSPRSAELHGQRARVRRWRLLGSLASARCCVCALPLPHRTHAPGVVWLPDEAHRAARRRRLRRAGAGARRRQRQRRHAAAAPVQRTAATVDCATVEAELQQQQVERSSPFSTTMRCARRWPTTNSRASAPSATRLHRARRPSSWCAPASPAASRSIRSRTRRRAPSGAGPGGCARAAGSGAPLVRALVSNEDIALVRAAPGRDRGRAGACRRRRRCPRLDGAVPQARRRCRHAGAGRSCAAAPIALDAGDAQGLTAREPCFELDLRLRRRRRAHIGARALVTLPPRRCELPPSCSARSCAALPAPLQAMNGHVLPAARPRLRRLSAARDRRADGDGAARRAGAGCAPRSPRAARRDCRDAIAHASGRAQAAPGIDRRRGAATHTLADAARAPATRTACKARRPAGRWRWSRVAMARTSA